MKVASFIATLVHLLFLNAQGFRSLDKGKLGILLEHKTLTFYSCNSVIVVRHWTFPDFAHDFPLMPFFFSLSNLVASGVLVIFLFRPSLQKAHVIFGLDVHTIAVEFYLGSQSVRAFNVYAPAQHNLSF